MKKLLLAVALCFGLLAQAQLNVGNIEMVHFKAGQFEDGEIAALQSTKTLFVYRAVDEPYLELLKNSLKGAWTITELEFISYAEFSKMKKLDGYSVFSMGGILKTRRSSSGMETQNDHYYMTLRAFDGKEEIVYARIELFLKFTSIEQMRILKGPKQNKYLYESAEIFNWFPGMIKNSLQTINKYLLAEETRWMYANSNTPELQNLKEDTLFVVDYSLVKFAKFTGDETERYAPEDIMGKYPYAYEFISNEALSERIMNGQKCYYLYFVKSSTEKYVNVINSETGEIIYSAYKSASYNISSKDIKKIIKLLK